MFEIINSLSKQEQFEFFQSIRSKIAISQSEIARAANVSHGLVSAVFNGMNKNQKVIEIIELNIQDGWQELIPTKVKISLKEAVS